MKIKRAVQQVFLLATLMALSVAVYATGWNDPDDQYTGPYVGAELGANSYGIDQSTTAISGSPRTNPGANLNSTLDATGVEGGLLLGYGYRFPHHLYLGGEIYGMLDSATANASSFAITSSASASYGIKMKMEGSYGLAIDPGIFLTPNTLLYLTAGPTATVLNSSPVNGDAGLNGSSNPFTKNLVGGRFGAGIESAIAKNLNIRAEYDYSFFPSFDENSVSPTYGTVQTHYKIYDNAALVSLIYHM